MTRPANEMESAPETAAYRHHRRMAWQAIRAQFADVAHNALLDGADQDVALEMAARTVRGDIRSLMSELLTLAPVDDVIEFLSTGMEWGASGERLLAQSETVVALIDSAYPSPIWARIGAIDREVADDDAHWTTWTRAWAAALCATGPAARAVLYGEPPPRATKARTSSTPRWWGRWLASAIVVVGATAVVAVAARE